eukprot:TRINITY_DN5361_c0_g1_i1.p2 TRINITY_DN5361_c0_g1~~TRINITY_DN5361_c0_g1_i1.p2  ORF type:complete len:188 (-),score=27.58 TRINITY_DN5361_c0_g1_i1:275-838(-)
MHPGIGYCQAMNYFAAALLFFLEEEESFWILSTTIREVLPQNYYCNNLIGVQIDVEAFRMIFSHRYPKINKHLLDNDVDVGIFVTQWFLCLYINVLPMESTMRFLDAFFYEGSKMLFRIGLALFNMNKKLLFEQKETSILMALCQDLPLAATDPDVLFKFAYDETLANFSVDELDTYRKQAQIKLGM